MVDKQANPQQDPHWLTSLLLKDPKLAQRFTHFYTQLQSMPRRARRVLRKKTAVTLSTLALMLALSAQPLFANQITVDTTTQGINNGDGFCSLAEAIVTANNGASYADCVSVDDGDTLNTIILGGGTYSLTAVDNTAYGATGLPVVYSRVVISGNGATITRDVTAPDMRLMTVSNGELTIDNATLSGGYATDANRNGGAIASYYSDVTITNNSVITGNQTTNGRGGGISLYSYAQDITLTIQNSVVSNNQANRSGGGASLYDGDIGSTVVNIENSIISGNTTSNGDGGGIHNYSFYANSLINIQNSMISGNIAQGTGNNGGGIYNYGYLDTIITVDNSLISGNYAPSRGGGIYNNGYGLATLTITNTSVISGNSTAFSGEGGGIFHRGDTNIDPVFLHIHNSTVANNTSQQGGGIYHTDFGYGGNIALIENSTISGNTASQTGGGLHQQEGTTTIDNTVFNGNDASQGGAIFNGAISSSECEGACPPTLPASIVTIQNSSTLTGNTASSNGAGIMNSGFITGSTNIINIYDSLITLNTTQGDGGGIANEGRYGTAVINGNNATISNNTAQSIQGGGIYNNTRYGTANVTLIGSTISGNAVNTISPNGFGGGIANSKLSPTSTATIALYSSTVTGNQVIAGSFGFGFGAGGGLYNNRGSAIIDDTTFSGNQADSGGAIVNGGFPNFCDGLPDCPPTPSSSVTIQNSSIITGNTAGGGGGIDNVNFITTTTNIVTINDSVVSNNQATSYGGGGVSNFARYGTAVITTNNSTIANNTAVTFGGGLDNSSSKGTANLTFNNSTISGNTTGEAGGGISSTSNEAGSSANLTLNNSTLTGNQATIFESSGGGIYSNNYHPDSSATATLNRSLVSGNSARYGDEVYSSDVTIANNGNLFGVSGNAGLYGFAAGANDLINNQTLANTLDTTLQNNGGNTPTHALVSSSPAIDMVPQVDCTAGPINGLDQRGEQRDDWACDAGAFELKLADSTSVSKEINGAGTFTFGPTLVRTEIVDDGSCLTGLTINRVESNHPNATSGIATGRYWEITPIGCTTGFTVTLTLPMDVTPSASDKACRFTGAGWDCGEDAQNSGSSAGPVAMPDIVTRQNVTQFSDWAVGNSVGPTAVNLQSLMTEAESNKGVIATLFGTMVATLGAWWTRRRKQQS